MYLVTAIINSECISDILEDLSASGIEGVTISEVIGKGRLIDVDTNKMDTHARLDIVVSNDTYKNLAKEAIRVNARELERGSGKIWVTPVLEIERIRTGETNEDALSHAADDTSESIHADEFYMPADTPSS